MSDTQAAETATQGAANPAGTSPGAMLRELRTAAGMDLAVLASMVKVAPQKLDALEHDHYEQLPDLTFARGLAASVCRVLHADPKLVLARMPARTPPLHVAPEEVPEVAFRRPGDDPAPLLSGTAAKVVVTLVAVLLIGSALVWFWPTSPSRLAHADGAEHEDAPAVSSAPVASDASGTVAHAGAADVPEDESHAASPGATAVPTAPAPASTASAPTNAPAGATATAPATAATNAAQPAPAGAVAAANPGGAATTVAAAATTAAAQPGAATPATPTPTADDASAATSQLLTLKATGESWVGVKDATGKSLLNRTLKSGETVTLDGTPPLAVVLGRKQDVDVLVRGQPFDTQKLGSATVARFQVK